MGRAARPPSLGSYAHPGRRLGGPHRLGIRHIPSAEPATDIRVTHFAYDLEPAREDPNIVFPVDRLRELVDEGVIGGLAPTALGCMGGIYSVRRTEQELAPAIVNEVLAMRDAGQADVALLVPV